MSELWLLRKLERHMTVGVPCGDAAPNVDHILGGGDADVMEETAADAAVDLTADDTSFREVDVEACIMASEHWQQLFGRAPAGRAPAPVRVKLEQGAQEAAEPIPAADVAADEMQKLRRRAEAAEAEAAHQKRRAEEAEAEVETAKREAREAKQQQRALELERERTAATPSAEAPGAKDPNIVNIKVRGQVKPCP
jgi:hypothetical protein